jgi:FemAB-related protein (PEP-CTERM system-associated)
MSQFEVEIITPRTFSSDLVANTGGTLHADLEHATRWLTILRAGLQHEPYAILVRSAGVVVGLLPLAFVRSLLFGRYLVSLPYINSAGVVAESAEVTRLLVDHAVQLADQLDVNYLELRQEIEVAHPSLTERNDTKVIMRLALPDTVDALWNSFRSKLRSQIKSGQKREFEVLFGGEELLREFYAVFSHNMRDLGTPVYSQQLFASILREYHGHAELCVLRLQGQAVAGALLVHDAQRTEVPSASSLRAFNSTNANMVMYWHLLARAVERGQRTFDFGRSTRDGSTYRFKEQWGAVPSASCWQYYLRRGSAEKLRPTNSKFGLAIRVWQRLPVALTRWIGPPIVRGIP